MQHSTGGDDDRFIGQGYSMKHIDSDQHDGDGGQDGIDHIRNLTLNSCCKLRTLYLI